MRGTDLNKLWNLSGSQRKYCDICQKVGHHCEKEKRKVQKKWQSKAQVEAQKKPKEVCTLNNPIEGT